MPTVMRGAAWAGPISLPSNGTYIPFNMAGAPLIAYVVVYPTAGDTVTVQQSRDGKLLSDPTKIWSTILTATALDTGVQINGGCPDIQVKSSGPSSTSFFTVV